MKKEKKLESLKIDSDLFDSTNISMINGGAFIETLYCTVSVPLAKGGITHTNHKDGIKVGNVTIDYKF